jgi:hypothetical protein
MDQQWEIDVTKSKARPPDALRKDLKRIADLTRKSRERYLPSSRQESLHEANSAPHVFAWEKKVKARKDFLFQLTATIPLVNDVPFPHAGASQVAS